MKLLALFLVILSVQAWAENPPCVDLSGQFRLVEGESPVTGLDLVQKECESVAAKTERDEVWSQSIDWVFDGKTRVERDNDFVRITHTFIIDGEKMDFIRVSEHKDQGMVLVTKGILFLVEDGKYLVEKVTLYVGSREIKTFKNTYERVPK